MGPHVSRGTPPCHLPHTSSCRHAACTFGASRRAFEPAGATPPLAPLQVCYVSQYTGRDRGVLVQLGQLQFGHFPLGFFDEAMSKPPPPAFLLQ